MDTSWQKNNFYGDGIRPEIEWNVWDDLQWELLQFQPHLGIRNLVDDLNKLYKSEPALWRNDFDPYGFQWIDCDDRSNSVISFMRRETDTNEWLVIAANFTPNIHETYKIGVPLKGFYKEIFNSDASRYGAVSYTHLTLPTKG